MEPPSKLCSSAVSFMHTFCVHRPVGPGHNRPLSSGSNIKWAVCMCILTSTPKWKCVIQRACNSIHLTEPSYFLHLNTLDYSSSEVEIYIKHLYITGLTKEHLIWIRSSQIESFLTNISLKGEGNCLMLSLYINCPSWTNKPVFNFQNCIIQKKIICVCPEICIINNTNRSFL